MVLFSATFVNREVELFPLSGSADMKMVGFILFVKIVFGLICLKGCPFLSIVIKNTQALAVKSN